MTYGRPRGYDEAYRLARLDPVPNGRTEVVTATQNGARPIHNQADFNGPGSPSWPQLQEEALHGLPGRIVRVIEPHTEADPVALLTNLLCAFGSAVGRGSYVVGGDRHYLNLYFGLTGETSKGRKGTSLTIPYQLMLQADREWAIERVQNGLATGEGLIHAVRDSVTSTNKAGEPVVTDEGVTDKRFMVVEGEFARVLKVMTREGNTLSAIVRQAWDGSKLQVLTRNTPAKATDAHVSILGHITKSELLRHLSESETANGFANRFQWLMVRRSKILPFGGELHEADAAPLIAQLREALDFAKSAGKITWADDAASLWEEVYEDLSEGKPGLFGAVVGRAEAQTLRLASVYAVMDQSPTIKLPHLRAALALWRYAEDSARYIFGDATGDPIADRIDTALKEAGEEGLSRTNISHLFNGHETAGRIGSALSLLANTGRARRRSEETGGRKAERWFST